MTFARLLRTASRIPPSQLAARARAMLRKRRYAAHPEAPIAAARRAAQGSAPRADLPRLADEVLAPEGIDAVRFRATRLSAGRFRYLAREEDFSSGIRWAAEGASPLWRYQLQYLGSVLDLAIAGDAAGAARIVSSWTREFGGRWDAAAWHPYPVSLRLANLCHAAGVLGSFAPLGGHELVATHAAFLLDHVEHDVRGNHILENARALLAAGAFLDGPLSLRASAEGAAILARELPEQVLADGGHFELSPMYHSIVLWRLLEIEALAAFQPVALDAAPVRDAIASMRRFLRATLCPDGEVLLFGDSARGFAPPAAALLGRSPAGAAAQGDGLHHFPETGIAVFRGDGLWAAFDVGETCPAYLPAHGQADSLTVEVWCGGRRIVGDPGVCEYTGPERAWGRSSRAHSTLTVDDGDTSEVYGSFRVGGRAKVERVMTRRERGEVTAAMETWCGSARFTRIVSFGDESRTTLRIVDDGTVRCGETARSRLHLAPGVEIVERSGRARVVRSGSVLVRIESDAGLREEPGRSSPEFGVVVPTVILVQDLLREGRPDVHGGWRIAAEAGAP